MGYVSSNIIKWVGIVLIILLFMPIFNYGGSSEPIWAFFVDINWESGLNLNRYSGNQMEIGIYLAIFQFIIGFLLAILGSLGARAAKIEIGI
jgi:hypothetical protein